MARRAERPASQPSPASPRHLQLLLCTCVDGLRDGFGTVARLALPWVPPVFITELQNQEVQDGYPVSFDCVVIGKPMPTVRWFKDGHVLEEDDHYMINEDQEGCHQLIITAVVPLDMGVYRCVAENSMGVSSTKAELRVDRELKAGIREQEGVESTTEEEQLPQIIDELHDIHVAPGAPVAKFHLKVKGNRYFNSLSPPPPPHTHLQSLG
uniref:Ig-like domain-containing protein n=1 Tax=Pseudonaja textilis TaxID=8673 RepID=A0A670YS63_PSETE